MSNFKVSLLRRGRNSKSLEKRKSKKKKKKEKKKNTE